MEPEQKVLTVSEFTKIINETVSRIGLIWIEGEVTDFKNWQNVQIYFKLKDLSDESTVLNCGIPKYKLDRLGFIIEDGMKIRIMGFAALFNILMNVILIPKFDATGAAIATLITEIILLLSFYLVVNKFIFNKGVHNL